jgi:hypothetical protein
VTDTYSEQTSTPANGANAYGENWASATPQPARLHELMAPEQNLQRIMWTGTIWFTAAVGSIAVVLGLLLSSGWRPYDLPLGAEVLWWFGSAVTTLSVGLIGWSGCPILEVSVPVADKNKSRTMQFGTAMFIGGGAISLFAVLLGPVA